MKTYDPIDIPNLAWLGCKITNAIALWTALILGMPLLILIPLATHGISAIFGPRYAPLLVILRGIDRLLPKKARTKNIVVDSHALRFAHSISAVFSTISLALIYASLATFGWIIVFCLAGFTTLGAFGFCTATKLYDCAVHGTCCVRKK